MSNSEVHRITVRKEYLDELIAKANKLNALEAAGVDNWEGYDYVMDLLEKGIQ